MAVINTNIAALTAQRNLGIVDTQLQRSIERLSSGLRINRASDDAAGLSISEKLRAQTAGINQAVRNAQDGVSMVQTAEGALNEVSGILQRMRELAVQASNSTLSTADRNAVQVELTQLSSAFTTISTNTKFNGLSLLTGNLAVTISAGTIAEASANFSLTADISGLKTGTATTAYTLTACGTTSLATFAGGGVTQEISYRSMVANDAQVLNFDRIGLKIQLLSTAAVTTTAIATDLNNDTITVAANSPAATIQIGPDAGVSNQLNLNFTAVSPTTTGLTAPDVSTVAAANSLITTVDTAIDTVSSQRATLGALQNSLETTIRNLNVVSENLTAAESRIRDLDIASETVRFTRSQILQQAGTAILAQANLSTGSVLSLLR